MCDQVVHVLLGVSLLVALVGLGLTIWVLVKWSQRRRG